MAALARQTSDGVTLLTDESRPGGVTLAFTERTGGVSEAPYASLNLGSRCGDDPARVAENRRRALAALGAEDLLDRLVVPRQVHGDHAVIVRSADPDALAAARAEAGSGADAVVCTAPGVPVLMCFADCVPVVLAAPGAFAVVHSGWRGTIARIAGKAARELARAAGADASELRAYVGPHIRARDYEVSEELAGRFADEFGPSVVSGRQLDLSRAVLAALAEAGVPERSVAVCETSTASSGGRFFSYRAQHGTCGRHGALAFLGERTREVSADDEGEATLR